MWDEFTPKRDDYKNQWPWSESFEISHNSIEEFKNAQINDIKHNLCNANPFHFFQLKSKWRERENANIQNVIPDTAIAYGQHLWQIALQSEMQSI